MGSHFQSTWRLSHFHSHFHGTFCTILTKPRDNFGLVVVGGDLYAVGGSVAIGSQVGQENDDDDNDYDDEKIYDDDENYLLHFSVTNESECKSKS